MQVALADLRPTSPTYKATETVEIGEIAQCKARGHRVAIDRQATNQRFTGLGLPVEESHLRALRGKAADQRLADAARATGYQHAFAGETGIFRRRFLILCRSSQHAQSPV